ncbi:MAG TPA: ATP-binding cassette domain-containing protein [Patescibacteria group bacterium]|nr:ATP-binding cassette domain-containing protein [Patescibacteria group bacterium]
MNKTVIEVKNLKKYYQVYKKEPGIAGSIKSIFNRQYFDVKAINDVSFKINEGELVGFIGPNGAGKTTTLKTLSGLLYPSDGRINVLGINPSDRNPILQKQFSLIMGQKNQLWWDLPIWESLLLNKAIYEIPDDEFNQNINELTDLLDLKDYLHIQARKLSLGQRMKSELLVALLHTPKILFLDEPTIGLDVVAQKKMRDFIKEYNHKHNATILLTSHYMEDVKELCKRIIVIDKGKIIYDGSLEKIVSKYAKYKIIKIDFDNKPDIKKLEEIGEVKALDDFHAKIYVPREESIKRAIHLLEHFEITDFVVEELPIEEIIRQMFENSK